MGFLLDKMKLYKYRYGSKRDLEALQNNYFYAPHSTQLNDPSENLFSEKDIHKVFELFHNIFSFSTSDIRKEFDQLCQKVRKEVGIYSLSRIQKDELLWAYYADSHTGFCIEYDFEKLDELRPISAAFEIDYAEQRPELKFDHVFKNGATAVEKLLRVTTGTKSIKWRHEEEYRICIEPFGRFNYDYRAVKAIYFGMRMPKSKIDLIKNNNKLPDSYAKVCQQQVMEVLKGRGIKYYQMKLKEDSYEFDCYEIADIYQNSQKYKDKVHLIPKNLIDYNDYGRGVERGYFDKVAEIISKEPYFYELNSIHISKEESIKKNQPVIFAGFFYEKNNLRQIKRYFTLDEVNEKYSLLNMG